MRRKKLEEKKGAKMDFISEDEIKKLDPKDTYHSTLNLVTQAQEAFSQSSSVSIKHSFSDIKNVIFCGMGASIYGALVLKALQGNFLNFPIEIITDYHIPSYVNHQSLVVLTSYSGTTEEVLSCANEALTAKAKIIVLTKGGALAEFAKENKLTSYIFDGKLNPSSVPRLGAGYTILGLLGILNQAKVISLEEKQIENAFIRIKENLSSLEAKAKADLEKYINKIPIIIASEHLSGNAQILRNQFNETSKTFSAYYLIPDLNHHLMEGLKFPQRSNLIFTIFNSQNYSPKIYKRIELTKQVIEKNHKQIETYTTSGATLYDDFLEVLIYGSFLTFYLSIYYKQNPATNPWVDYFKKELELQI